ncbi:hypothetical protein ACVDG3_03660 [Meridianimarinicoccus sp. RP-17]|uniref:hypothetical protein n=1 Tax=Meridianimarinicoccus zhengii TaxID=2056810 RepID=UPI000DAD1D2D|nr:hypothetical protein [Phycocomes zhengii]
MTVFKAALAVTALALAGCDATMDSAETTAVTPLLDRQLVADSGTTFLFRPDGTVGGSLGDAPIEGTYTVEGAEICSSYTAPASLAGQTYCSTPMIEGDTVRFARRDGGMSPSYTIGG